MPRSLASPLSIFVTTVIAAAATMSVVAVSANSATAVPVHNPLGHLDSLTLTGAVASYHGWAADPDVTGTVRVVVLLDKTVVRTRLANETRADVARAIPRFGTKRGYSGTLTVPPGRHTICLVAGDLGVGSDSALGCKTVTAPRVTGSTPASTTPGKKPIGHLDGFAYRAATRALSVSGWTLDPDTRLPTYVDVMINGQSLGSAVANRSRPDVASKYSYYGPSRGFAYTVPGPVDPGNYELCVVAVNNAAGGNTVLPCRVITIRPVGDPAPLNVGTNATAAAAIQAQAIKSGAAKASNFPAGANSATRIAIASRAMLQQAVGRTAKPPAVTGIPAFKPAGPAKVVDEQAVMGPRPPMGSYPPLKSGGRAGVARSLQLFADDGLTPPGGQGVGIVGAAPVLLANGRTVRPTMPGYPAGYARLRAEVALDAALAHIGDPYVFAAGGPNTFDCSGLVQWAFAKAGIGLTHYTGTQAFEGVRIQPNQLLPGDLVLFGADLHHVGIYLGAGYMLNAPETGAYVRVDKISWFADFSLAVRP